VILSLALASCRGSVYIPTATPDTIPVRILATTTTYSLLQELTYGYQPKGLVLAVHSAAGDWNTVYSQLLAGDIPYALTTYLSADAPLWVAPIGQSGIAIIVQTSNTISRLTLSDLRLIFQGRIANWSELGGPDLAITVVSREEGSDLRLAFDAQVMGGRHPTLAAQLALSEQSMITEVEATPGAIGYVSVSMVDSRGRTVPVSVDPEAAAVLPTRDTLHDSSYPLCTPLMMVGLHAPDPSSAYYAWFAWMQSDAGQQVINQHYPLP
jgi:phosphate transport system substrate-binding protein